MSSLSERFSDSDPSGFSSTLSQLLERESEYVCLNSSLLPVSAAGQIAIDVSLLTLLSGNSRTADDVTSSVDLTDCQRWALELLNSAQEGTDEPKRVARPIVTEYHSLGRLLFAGICPREVRPNPVKVARDVAYLLQRCAFVEAAQASVALICLEVETDLLIQFRFDVIKYLSALVGVSSTPRFEFEVALLKQAANINGVKFA